MAYLDDAEDFVDIEEDLELEEELEHVEPRPIEDERRNKDTGNTKKDREPVAETIFDQDAERSTARSSAMTKPLPPPPPEGARDAIPIEDADIQSAVAGNSKKPDLSINPTGRNDDDLPPLISEKLDLERRGLSPGHTPFPIPAKLQVGSFSTDEIRLAGEPRTLHMSPRRFPEPFSLDASVPTVLHGFFGLDVDHKRNTRVRASSSDVGYFGFTGFNNGWGDTILYRAASNYLAVSGSSDDVDSGIVNVKEGFECTEKTIQFAQKFTSPPNVLVWISGLDVEHGRNTRIKLSASSITTTGFKLKIKTWMDTFLHCDTEATWFAFAEDKIGIASGRFHTKIKPEPNSRGYIKFVPEGDNCAFMTTPRVFLAFDFLDVYKDWNTRVWTEASKVDREGFEWSIKTWGNTKAYQLGVTYVAIE